MTGPDLTGAQIRNALVKAASVAALRPADGRLVSQEDLEKAATEEEAARGGAVSIGFGADLH